MIRSGEKVALSLLRRVEFRGAAEKRGTSFRITSFRDWRKFRNARAMMSVKFIVAGCRLAVVSYRYFLNSALRAPHSEPVLKLKICLNLTKL